METINGKPLSAFGAMLDAKSYSALMTPPSLKPFVENNDRSKNGVEILIPEDEKGDPTPLIADRDVTLQFLICGSTQEKYLANYTAFVAELKKAALVLEVPQLGREFHLIYSNSTQFDNYHNACTLSVKFREPNPTKTK